MVGVSVASCVATMTTVSGPESRPILRHLLSLSWWWSRSCYHGATCGKKCHLIDAWISLVQGVQLSAMKVTIEVGAASSSTCLGSTIWNRPTWAPMSFVARVSLAVVWGKVEVAGSWRSDDDDARWRPQRWSFFSMAFVLLVGGQVGRFARCGHIWLHIDAL
jgi:hypothetical protein